MAATPPTSSTAFLRIPGVELACASFIRRALTLTAQPDGHATLAAAAIVIQAVRATTAGARVDIERVALEDVLAEVEPIAGVPAITSFVARHVVVEHLRTALARGAVAAGDAPQPLQLDALRRLDGLVHAFVKDGRIDEAEELFRRALDVEPAGSREACANAVRYGASFEPARTYCMRYGL